MFLIVGLGNPGAEYVGTRHNVGFMVVDCICKKFGCGVYKSKFDGEIAEGKIGSEKVLILKPATYMNLSGNSVVKAAHFYKILPENIVVIHDDMDLEIGKIKAKIGGGSGGHNGIKSIDAAISPNYNRVRIGVGHFVRGTKNAADYVLGHFSKAEQEQIDNEALMVADIIDILLTKGVAAFSNKLGEMLQKSAPKNNLKDTKEK